MIENLMSLLFAAVLTLLILVGAIKLSVFLATKFPFVK